MGYVEELRKLVESRKLIMPGVRAHRLMGDHIQQFLTTGEIIVD